MIPEPAAQTLADRLQGRLPSMMFSRYGYPEEWDRVLWGVHLKPTEWIDLISKLRALETTNEEILAILRYIQKEIQAGNEGGAVADLQTLITKLVAKGKKGPQR